MKTAIVRFAYLLAFTSLAVSSRAGTFPSGFQATQIKSGLNPTDLLVSPDGTRLLVTDKSGKVFLVQNDVWNNTPVLDISAQVDPYNERGLGHLCFDPAFATNGWVYFYYTVAGANHNRIARYTFNFGTNTFNPASAFIVLELPNLLATIHNAGVMRFGPDGKMYVALGENSQPQWGQATNTILGKVIRLNSDGSIPTDNPFYNTFTGNSRYIYAIGMRNPFSGDMQPGTGKFFVNDVGQSDWEEVDDIIAGKNYGWAITEGPIQGGQTPPANYLDPIYSYNHNTGGCAVVGGAFYNPTNATFPAQYVGRYFFGDYCAQTIKVMNSTTHAIESTFATGLGRVLALAVRNDDGALYYIDRGGIPGQGGDVTDNTSSSAGVLWKVVYTGSQVPTIAAHPQPVTASVGGNAVFSVVANGPSLSYQWKKNGINVPGATHDTISLVNVQLADNGAVFSCFVSNSFGNVTSNGAALTVTNRQPPVPTITLPTIGTTYRGGMTINYAGGATDAVQGNLPANSLSWTIVFHHDTHTHPFIDLVSGVGSGSFVIPTIGEVSPNVWFRIHLTAINDAGLTGSTYMDVQPQKVILSGRTVPAGILLNMDGTTGITPVDTASVIGVERNWTAPASYTIGDTTYNFLQWDNSSTNPLRTFITPTTNTTYTATYQATATFTGNGLKGDYYANTTSFVGTPAFSRTDTVVSFNWGAAGPGGGVSADNFCVRWTGQVQPPTSGTYTFYTFSDNGTRLWVNNQLIIDNWTAPSASEVNGTISLTGGTKYNIRLDFFETAGNATVFMQWSGPSVAKAVIPKRSLFATAAIVPVIFKSVTVTPSASSIRVNWSVAETLEVKGYYVERRMLGNTNFEDLTFVPAVGNQSDYAFDDVTAESNIVYEYRIREEDLDGTPTYSLTRTGFLSGKVDLDVVTLPNPAIASNIIKIIFNRPADAELSFVTSDGRLLQKQSAAASSGTTMYDLPTKGYAKGVYYLKIVTKEKTMTKKIMIQ